jgi:hypothetical protein
VLPTQVRYLRCGARGGWGSCILRLARRAPVDDASGAKVVLRVKVIVGVIAVVEKEVYVVASRKEVG